MSALETLAHFVDTHGTLAIVFQTVVLLCLRSVVGAVVNFFARGKMESTKQAKLSESLWFFLYYTCIFTAGVIYLWDKEWLWEVRQYWNADHMNLPDFPFGLQLIYITQTAYYIGASIVVLFLSHARANHKDKLIMLTHHAVTVTLLAVSYGFGQHRIGSVVLILHDVSDIFLEGAKLCRYAGLESVTNMAFGVFALVFFVSRLVVFPLRVLYPTYIYFPSDFKYVVTQCDAVRNICIETPFVSFTVPWFWLALLGTLQCLHIYWFALIFRMVVRAITDRHIEKDIRSDDEEDAPEDVSESPKKRRANGKSNGTASHRTKRQD